MTNCNQIAVESARLKTMFAKCYNLRAVDLRAIVDLIESVSACSGGSFNLKTVNGQSLLGTGDIVVTAVVDGTETKIQQSTGITVTGNGSIANPYTIATTITQATGSETKINQGSNVTIAGTGTTIDPYVINANVSAGSAQVNSDWASTSGISQILNKPSIPAAQINADWNATSGLAQILNKPTSLGGLQEVLNANGFAQSTSGNASLDISILDTAAYMDFSNYNDNKTLEYRLSNGSFRILISNNTLNTESLFRVSSDGTFELKSRLGLYNTTFQRLDPVANTILNLPAKAAGTYTLATTDDIVAPTLQAVLDAGGFASTDAGASYIDIFATFAGKKYSELIHTFTTNSAGWLIKDSQAQIGSHMSGFRSGVIDVTLAKVTISERNSATENTNVQFTTAIAETTLNFPAKPTGTYTLATTDEILAKQNTLVSGTNIKSINSTTLLGAGDMSIGLGDVIKENGYAQSLSGNSYLDIGLSNSGGYMEFSDYNSSATGRNLEFRLNAYNYRLTLTNTTTDTSSEFRLLPDSTFKLSSTVGLNSTTLERIAPIAVTTLNLPAKTIGVYNLATSVNGIEANSSGNIVIATSNWTKTGNDILNNNTGKVGTSGVFYTGGSLGVGVDTPLVNLHVKNTGDAVYTRLQGVSDGDNYSVLELWDGVGNSKWQFAHKSAVGFTKDFEFAHFNGTSWSVPFAIKDNGTLRVSSLSGTALRAVVSNATGELSSSGLVPLNSYTVATLPAGQQQGTLAFVTDALAPTYLGIVAGGGAIVAPVFYNGTNWVSH